LRSRQGRKAVRARETGHQNGHQAKQACFSKLSIGVGQAQ